jgi:hypothetical protein
MEAPGVLAVILWRRGLMSWKNCDSNFLPSSSGGRRGFPAVQGSLVAGKRAASRRGGLGQGLRAIVGDGAGEIRGAGLVRKAGGKCWKCL